MSYFEYEQPVKVVFGENTLTEKLDKILDELKVNKPILVIDSFLVDSGELQKIKDSTKLSDYFCDFSPNPKLCEIDKLSKLIKENGYDSIVAVGGGSCMDTAKVASCQSQTDLPLEDFFEKKCQYESTLPKILVPTTSGTGSEVTSVAVVTNESKKSPMASKLFAANIAIIDPTLTYSMPKSLTANSGMDVLCHALEAFYSVNHQPICDALAKQAAKLVFENLEDVYDDPNFIKGRERMSRASVIAGMAFALPKTAGPHGVSYALTTDYHMPHGEACAFTADKFVLINKYAENGRLNAMAKYCGFLNCDDMAKKIVEMKQHMNMKITLSDAGIKEEDLPALAKKCINPNTNNNPVKMTEQSIIDMFLLLK